MNRRGFLAASTSALALAGIANRARAQAAPSLFERVRQLLRNLGERGWESVFAAHGLALDGPLEPRSLLETPLAVDRTRRGFSDMSPEARFAFAAGDPALSVVYHALACPDVHPSPLHGATTDDAQYPTLEELDLLENYIWSLNRFNLGTLADLEPQVLAYQYRPSSQTGHGAHADLVFSRTVITRFGNRPPVYDARMRCFRPEADDPQSVRVMPGRVGVFLIRKGAGPSAVAVMSARRQPRPVATPAPVAHKLFDGSECIPARDLLVSFETLHTNRKLAKAFAGRRGLTNENERGEPYDLSLPPFTRISRNGSDFTEAGLHGDSLIVGVKPEPLIDVAVQDQVVTVAVPAESFPDLINRRYTSLRLSDRMGDLLQEGLAVQLREIRGAPTTPPFDYSRPRNAPEFVNIRHRVDGWNPQTRTATLVDMRQAPAGRRAFLDAVAAGGRRSPLFVDGSAEGLVAATVEGVELAEVRPAYSIIAPPDFFPHASQYEIFKWVERQRNTSNSRLFRQGAPDPLCFGDLPPSPEIRDLQGRQAFDRSDGGIVAVYSARPRGDAPGARPAAAGVLTTFMTDAATNIFAPGWDVTYGGSPEAGYHYTTEGLGSPFPEDVKLCAAANAMWPAVSPDASRTFGRQATPTAIPMLDEELGIHPGHPFAGGGSFTGWDGEFGPYLTPDGFVNFADIERSDYVANLRDGLWRFDRLAKIDAAEIVSRMSALQRALCKIEGPQRRPEFSKLWLVSAIATDWGASPGGPGLQGKGYRFLFVTADSEKAEQSVPGRLETAVQGDVVLAKVDSSQVRTATEGDARKALRLYTV